MRRFDIFMKAAIVALLIAAPGCGGAKKGATASPAASPSVSSTPAASPDESSGPPSSTSPKPSPAASSRPTQPDSIAKQIDQMTLDEKIGQLLLIGTEGNGWSEQTGKFIRDRHVGGFVLYKGDLKDARQTVDLVNLLKAANADNPVPLFIGADQEGGRVSRLPAAFAPVPAMGTVGKTGDAAYAKRIGEALGEEVQAAGLNVDYAPVLDINSNPNNPVIGDRSFGTRADTVSRLGIAAMKGFQAKKVVPVVKHFPGHGDTSVDSHIGLPIQQSTLTELRKRELVPFAEAVRKGADAVMVAHILLPAIDADHPASFSKPIIHDVLRGELGFQGVVMTDDLTMGAIANHYDIGEAAVLAVQAGCDMLMVAHEPSKQVAVIEALHKALREGRIAEKDLRAPLTRILTLKQHYSVDDDKVPYPDIAAVNKNVNAAVLSGATR